MSKLSQLLLHSGHAEHEIEWTHFAQIELRHRQVMNQLETTAKEDREVVEHAREQRRHTLIPFAPAAKKIAEEQRRAEAELENVRHLIVEEHHTLVDNQHHIHDALHGWLLEHDPDYRKSAEIERLRNRIHDDIRPLASLLVDLLARYGATRNEIAVSYDNSTHTLSAVALAALDRLVHSYELLREAQSRMAMRVEALNDLVNDSLFASMKLSMFEQILPPDCRRGMDYPELHANFEAGAVRVREAIGRLEEYFGAIETTPTMMGNILYNYRDELWKQYLAELESGEYERLAG